MVNRSKLITDDFRKHKIIYFMAVPVLLYYIIFHYIPIYGVVIAFKDFSPMRGVLGSSWVGFEHFQDFINGIYFWRLIRNTLLISLYSIVFGFPAPILLALMLNELRQKFFKRVVQSVSYVPHFISLMIVCGMMLEFTTLNGIVNDIVSFFGGERIAFMQDPNWFRTIFVSSGIWQEVGWGSIIYLAALSGINPQLYEAAKVDGAGRIRRIWSITIPGILPTIIIMLILRIGNVMEVGFEKIILLYNGSIYETADVIGTYVYRRGILEMDFSFSAAVGLFNSVINFMLLILANWLSRRSSGSSLW
ncbi:ABC transporter permease [Paenibacillus chungangensis]|uniref:ABC transporter permease n=1 Tax=Paenibacillus chungangensis TaxID=696535 RepID=A0ABW3HQA0_9BACL